MSNNKQTSVEWLIEQINQHYPEITWAYKKECEQAKAIHKEEIESTYDDAISDFRQDQERPLTGAEYYLINYKKNNL